MAEKTLGVEMHDAAFQYVKRYQSDDRLAIVEIGSRDINATERHMLVRSLFPNASWIGVDIHGGRGVDVVSDAITWRPPVAVDLVICCEVLEHCEHWEQLVFAAADMLKDGGMIIMTCAGPGRAPHSHYDGGGIRPGEYYGNLSTRQIGAAMLNAGLACIHIETAGNDTRCCAVKVGVSPDSRHDQHSCDVINTACAAQAVVTTTVTENLRAEPQSDTLLDGV